MEGRGTRHCHRKSHKCWMQTCSNCADELLAYLRESEICELLAKQEQAIQHALTYLLQTNHMDEYRSDLCDELQAVAAKTKLLGKTK